MRKIHSAEKQRTPTIVGVLCFRPDSNLSFSGSFCPRIEIRLRLHLFDYSLILLLVSVAIRIVFFVLCANSLLLIVKLAAGYI